jgi:hypothetical protein
VPRFRERADEKGRIWPLVIAALAVFAAFGSLQMILAALNVHLVHAAPAAPTSSHGVVLVQASDNPAPVVLPATAQPVNADQAMASMPSFSSSKETTLVSNEDTRIRTLLHDSAHVHQPQVVRYQGALPTLVLPARSAAYTVTDLVQQGAMTMLSNGVGLLQEDVFVASGAQLSLGTPALSTLYLASSANGFSSIIGYGGTLSFAGTAAQPLTIMSWNQATKSAVADQGNGRPYIREIGGAMTFAYARVSSLGFWSGRTAGVAWTGTSRASSKGGAADSAFTGDTYGAFVSRGQGVTFSADRFESNELDGLHIHRYSVGSQVISSSATRNGGNGFAVDRATTNTLMRGDVSQHNAANGYLFDGRPLVSGASASGGSNEPSSGTVLEDSSATGNAHTGVLMEGGTGTVVKSDQFCSPTTAIALRTGVTDAVLTGNYIDCAPRSGISVGPSAPGTVLFGNIVSRPGIGMLVRSSGAVSMYKNQIIGATVFGVSARDATSKVGGVGNVLSGTGDRAVDARTDASVSGLSGTDTSGWAHNARVTVLSYLEFHPLASLWLGILVVILLAAGWSFRRKLPAHPYPASVRGTYPLRAAEESSSPAQSRAAHVQPAAGRHTAPRAAAGRLRALQPATGRHTGSQPAAAQPAAVRRTTVQPAVGLQAPAQPAAGWHTASAPMAALPTTAPPTMGRQTASQPAAGRQTASQPVAGRNTAPHPAAARPTAIQPALGGHLAHQPAAPQPTAGRNTAPHPGAPSPAMGRHTASQPAVAHPMAAHPMAPPPAGAPPTVTGHTAPQPTAGRPALGPGMPPAVWNAPAWNAAGMPQPAPHQQPALPPAPYHQPPGQHAPAYLEPVHHEPGYREPAYREPSYGGPTYGGPTYGGPAQGPGRQHERAGESARPGWDPAHEAARWQQPLPAPLPALPALPAAPSDAPAGWADRTGSHGRASARQADGYPGTHGQPALPPEINRPYERERPADPSEEDARGTRPIPKGVWD